MWLMAAAAIIGMAACYRIGRLDGYKEGQRAAQRWHKYLDEQSH